MPNKLKVLVVGGSGGLASQLVPMMSEKYEVLTPSSKECNITNLSQLQEYCSNHTPEVVVNLSGINFDTPLHKINSTNEKNVQQLINVNALGNVNLLASCIPSMRERGFGRVILVSSVLSTRPVFGTAVYSATKTFIDSLVRTASVENIGKGITCNSIQLGYFDGGMCHRIPSQIADKIKDTIGLKRWGSIQELYNTIDYLVQTEYITGQNIEVSGGLI